MSTADARREFVQALPRRTAHAVHALIETSREHNSPVTSAEVCIYDSEALSAVSTGRALANARRHELAVFTGRYWVPTQRALVLRSALEDRYLAETADAEDG